MNRADAERLIQRLAELDTEFGWRPETRAEATRALVRWHEEAKDAVRDGVKRGGIDGKPDWFGRIVAAFDELGPRRADEVYLRYVFQRNPPAAGVPTRRGGPAERVRSILQQRIDHDRGRAEDDEDRVICYEGCAGWDVFDSNHGLEIEACDECNSYAYAQGLPTITDEDAAQLPEAQQRLVEAAQQLHPNPARASKKFVRDLIKRVETMSPEALEKYREFHRFDPKKVISCPGLVIPARLRLAGDAKHVMYRSNKVDPATMQKPRGTFDYIHEHDAGVRTYVPDGEIDTDVPSKFRPDPSDDPALVVLGKCLGFAFTDRDGELVEAEGRSPLPDLCCTPDGHCLYVVQSGREVLAMMWGGALGVFARGIDG